MVGDASTGGRLHPPDDFRANYVAGPLQPAAVDGIVCGAHLEGSYDYFENGAGIPETKIAQGIFGIEFENSDRLSANYEQRYDFVPQEFNAAGVVPIPVGEYDYQSIFLSYAMGQQRRVSGTLSLWSGDYYHGRINAVGYQRGRVEITPQFSLEPGLSINSISLPDAMYTVPLVTSRVHHTFTPRMFFGGLYSTARSRHHQRQPPPAVEYPAGAASCSSHNDQRDGGRLLVRRQAWPE